MATDTEVAHEGDDVDRSLARTLERLGARIKARAAERANLDPPLAKIIFLPSWPEAMRGVPNVALRSALFGAIKRGRRAFQERVVKASVDGYSIIHTGPQLDQADLDVWEQCLHLARTGGLGNELYFSSYSFLKAIGRATGGKNVEWLIRSLSRLTASVVEIKIRAQKDPEKSTPVLCWATDPTLGTRRCNRAECHHFKPDDCGYLS